MNWQIWKKSGVKDLPMKVQKTLQSEFKLEPKTVVKLRCMERGGRYSGRSVRYIRIYDPSMLQNGTKPVKKYGDFDSQQGLVLFQGHIEKNGAVYLADRRSTKSAHQSAAVVSQAQ